METTGTAERPARVWRIAVGVVLMLLSLGGIVQSGTRPPDNVSHGMWTAIGTLIGFCIVIAYGVVGLILFQSGLPRRRPIEGKRFARVWRIVLGVLFILWSLLAFIPPGEQMATLLQGGPEAIGLGFMLVVGGLGIWLLLSGLPKTFGQDEIAKMQKKKPA